MFKFKKIAAVLAGAVMLTSTVALAAAANYPAPFVQSGKADVAIVYGSTAANTDLVAALEINSDLTTKLAAQTATGTTTTSGSSASGGDSVRVHSASNEFNLGDTASTVLVTSINSDKMPTLLADGTYTDQDNTDYKYTQKISLGTALKLNHFSDSDYKDKTPVIGINLSDSQVLNYTLDFDTNPLFNASTLETTTMTMMGKSYYVLDVTNSIGTKKLTLLDSANSVLVTEGTPSTVTVGNQTYEVAISFIDSSKAKLTINGEETNSLSSGGTYKLKDGTYVGVKDILYSSKDSGVSKVDLSLGKGKLEIENGANVQLNDKTVNEIVGYINLDASAQLNTIVLVWTTDGKEFVTPDSAITMPGFESVKISMADFFAPKAEVTTVENSGNDVLDLNTPIKSGSASIPLVYASSGVYQDAGKDSNNQLAGTTIGAAGNFVFNQTAGDRYVIASWNSSTEAESYYLRVEMVQEDSVNKTRFTNVLDTSDIKTVSAGNDVSFGNAVITPSLINISGTQKWATLTAGAGVSFNTLYTVDGLKAYLPYVNSTALTDTAVVRVTAANACGNRTQVLNELYTGTITYNSSGTVTTTGTCATKLSFAEADKDGNLAKGSTFSLTLGANSDNHVQVSGVNGADAGFEIGDSNNNEYYVISDLATKIVDKTGGDQDSADITYAGSQSYADVFITSPSATVAAGSSATAGGTVTALGSVAVADSEVSSVSAKNLIVIGGNCVNSVAAKLIGASSADCGADFETLTGVIGGQALIKTLTSPYAADKVATLVAGRYAADTTMASKYLTTQTVDTTAGVGVKVTSATQAVALTTTA